MQRQGKKRSLPPSSSSPSSSSPPLSPSKPSTKPSKSSTIVDLTSDGDCDDDDDKAASLRFIAQLTSEKLRPGGHADDSEAASLALARKQQDVNQMAAMAQQILMGGGGAPALQGSDAFFRQLRLETDEYRRSCEGPPSAPPTTLIGPDGTKQRVRRCTNGWLEHSPVVACSDVEILAQLAQLGSPHPPNGRICANSSNERLLRLLCLLRQHVVETRFEKQKSGSNT